jgi:hypothetical protein
MGSMSIAQTAVAPSPTPAIPKDSDPAKIQDAAQQFEALLIGQILETVSQRKIPHRVAPTTLRRSNWRP